MIENGNPYLRLGAGESVYLDQVVAVEPDRKYRLSARLRQHDSEGSLSVPLCEKALLYSFACIWNQLAPKTPGNGWEESGLEVDSGSLGGGGNWPHRPVKLSLYNPGSHVIEVDDISLKTNDGNELLANGDFSEGVKRWLFITDQDIAWHIHQQWVEMYFAQGLLGLMAFVLLLAAVMSAVWPAMLSGNLQTTALAAALVAFLTVGLLGSTMDTARLSMLFYLGSFFAGFLNQTRENKTRNAARANPGRIHSRTTDMGNSS